MSTDKDKNKTATSIYTNPTVKNQTGQIKQSVPALGDGSGRVGIRATLNNMGISNDLIGYNEGTKTVTIGGRDFMKPSYMDEDAGISYASPDEIQSSLISYYSGSSNPLVKITDIYSALAGQYGLSADAITYTDDTVTLGGMPIDSVFVDSSGKAWGFKNDVTNSINSYINSLGVQTPSEIWSDYTYQYLDPIYDFADSLMNRQEFSYDPESDPVYQSYKQIYLTEGNRAAQDAMANYSALTGGYANSSAMTAGAQANQYYAQQLANQVPALAEAAFERYIQQYNSDIDLLENMTDLYDSAYYNAYSANNRTVSNINSTFGSNADRDAAAVERYWEQLFNEQEYNWNEMFNDQDYRLSDQKYNWTDILNGQQQLMNNNDIEAGSLDNLEQNIYLTYYNQILRAYLESQQLGNRLTEEEINRLILQNEYMLW